MEQEDYQQRMERVSRGVLEELQRLQKREGLTVADALHVLVSSLAAFAVAAQAHEDCVHQLLSHYTRQLVETNAQRGSTS